jgi:malate dehydrogenase (oxaloacetate-decarboxylating)
MGLGVLACGAKRVTDSMFMAAAMTLARISPTVTNQNASLLPCVSELRSVAVTIAMAVARQAQVDGVAKPCNTSELRHHIRDRIWEPRYCPYRKTKLQKQWTFTTSSPNALVTAR